MKTFWRITKLLGGYKWLTIAGFALAFAQMGLSLVVPRITQLTIDRALIGGETELLVWYGLALIGVGVVRFAVAVGTTPHDRQGQPRHRVRPAQPSLGAPPPSALTATSTAGRRASSCRAP